MQAADLDPGSGETMLDGTLVSDDPAPPMARGRRVRGELALALEVTALTSFTFSRPVLDSFGRSPETFIAHQSSTSDIVLFGVLVALVPALLVAGPSALSRVFGPTVRARVHLAVIVVLGGLGAWRMGRDITGWPNDATKLLLAGFLVGPLLGLLRWRVPASATFLRYAGGASVVFLLQFLLMSPTSDVAFGAPGRLDPKLEAQVASDLGDDPPPVVVVVLDALPTAALLDGTGQIDDELYPNFAALAGDSTWYRNNTTVDGFTTVAVPTLATGRFPEDRSPPRRHESENLFTLLGDSYDLHVQEELTGLCPERLCPRGDRAGLGTLLDDAVTWWGREETPAVFELPAVLNPQRYDAAEQWIDDLPVSAGGRPDLTFLHVVLPHQPWEYTEDGTLYHTGEWTPTGERGFYWSDAGAEVGRQRHMLQVAAADRLVGRLMDRLRDAGVYDDSLVVLTADHGQAFVPGAPGRFPHPDNLPYILWTPLFVKAPGQTEGGIDDSNTMSVDVVPTIADHLGVDIPWEVDGLPVSEARTGRDPDRKLLNEDELGAFEAPEGEPLVEINGPDYFDELLAADLVEGTGPDAVWKRTAHGDLFGRRVDDLRVGDPAGHEFVLDKPSNLDHVDITKPIRLELVGHADVPVDTPVALALNGTIGGLTTVENAPVGDGWLVHALIPPDMFRSGANELTVYVVEGEPGAETLRPLAMN